MSTDTAILLLTVILVLLALITLFFGDALLIRIGNVINRGYQWESKPVLDASTRKVEATISHGYDGSRYISSASVVVPQSLALRILWRITHSRKLPSLIIAANLLPAGRSELAPNKGLDLSGTLVPAVPLRTWQLWERQPRQKDPASERLFLLVKLDRKRQLIGKRVGVAPGRLEPVGAQVGSDKAS